MYMEKPGQNKKNSDPKHGTRYQHQTNPFPDKNSTVMKKCVKTIIQTTVSKVQITSKMDRFSNMPAHIEVSVWFQFGFIPLNIVEVPLFKPSKSLNIEQLDQWAFKAHQLVKASGTYNYRHCRIKVPTELNIENWRALCSNCHDQKLLDYLEYGFPLCINRDQFQLNTECTNHPSAVNFPSDVDAYFRKETKHKAFVGPCESIPFPVHFSPLLSRPKEGDTRRIIVNMSFPYGSSVNDSNSEYNGVDFQLRYPTVDDIVKSVQDLGNEALLSKIDVSRAFRNLRVDPFEYDALGLTWDGKSYIDISIPMGMKTGSALCQRTTDIIRHVMQTKNLQLY